MERNEFLSKLGISLVAVCAGCSLVSCGSDVKRDDPAPDPDEPAGGLFSINLGSELTAVGQTKISNGVILARIAAGNAVAAFTAVQVACTHEGTSINYNTAQGKFICPNHGSQFSTSGAVLLGPAAKALKAYTIAIDGSTLSVSS